MRMQKTLSQCNLLIRHPDSKNNINFFNEERLRVSPNVNKLNVFTKDACEILYNLN